MSPRGGVGLAINYFRARLTLSSHETPSIATFVRGLKAQLRTATVLAGSSYYHIISERFEGEKPESAVLAFSKPEPEPKPERRVWWGGLGTRSSPPELKFSGAGPPCRSPCPPGCKWRTRSPDFFLPPCPGYAGCGAPTSWKPPGQGPMLMCCSRLNYCSCTIGAVLVLRQWVTARPLLRHLSGCQAPEMQMTPAVPPFFSTLARSRADPGRMLIYRQTPAATPLPRALFHCAESAITELNPLRAAQRSFHGPPERVRQRPSFRRAPRGLAPEAAHRAL